LAGVGGEPDRQPICLASAFWSYSQSPTFAELFIDCEEDRTPAELARDMRAANLRP
jgi:hypothetical protein